MDIDVGSSLLLLGEFQSVAEDLDSLLLMTGSTCLGKLTVEAEHLPAPERTQQTTTVHRRPRLRTDKRSPRSGLTALANTQEEINLTLGGNGEEI